MILLVEDNEVNQEVINMQLSALGYDAMIAADGRIALDMWKNNDFDLILTDCHMPEMDGFELTVAIRKEELNTGTHIPIIAVTANAMSEELEECYASGMDDCLTKPVEMNDLGLAITKWMPVHTSASSTDVGEKITPAIDSGIDDTQQKRFCRSTGVNSAYRIRH